MHTSTRALLKNATIVLKDGRVAESGKPEDLMKQNGEFLKMVTSGSKAPSERLGER